MSKHTQGPWAVANVGWVASCATNQTICAMYAVKSGLDHTETDANACLIAAAPDLLEQLQMCAEALEDSGHYPLTLLDALKAIAKA